MQEGTQLRCVDPHGYALTLGKTYTVLSYEAAFRDETFTWPAYVGVLNDDGKLVKAHASRFVEDKA